MTLSLCNRVYVKRESGVSKCVLLWPRVIVFVFIWVPSQGTHSLTLSFSVSPAQSMRSFLTFPMPILISLVALSVSLCTSIMRYTYKLFLIDHPDGTATMKLIAAFSSSSGSCRTYLYITKLKQRTFRARVIDAVVKRSASTTRRTHERRTSERKIIKGRRKEEEKKIE